MIYKEHQHNHVILPGREDALASFLKQDYKGMQHKAAEGARCAHLLETLRLQH